MAVNYFQALDSFRNIFLQDGGIIAASPSNNIATPSGAAQTIGTTQFINRNVPGAACTGAILQAGTFNGQIVIVTNEATVVARSITFSATLATGLVLTDASSDANVILASSASMFIWLSSLNSGNGAWVKFGPFGG